MVCLVSIGEVRASDMAGIGVASLMLSAWGVIGALCLIVSCMVAADRRRREVPGAGWYLMVPVETAAVTIVATIVLGPQLGDVFAIVALAVPLLAWVGAHRLHREREPEFRYRGNGRSGRR